MVTQVSKRYGQTPILDRVDLTVHAGEIVALTGENGAGKTTLMRICAGLTRADSGRVTVSESIGYCPQSPSLFELLNADEHIVMFGRGIGLSRTAALARGNELLRELDFAAERNTVTTQMSGGTRQKLNLALALSLQQKDPEAIAELRKTLELKPGLYEADLNLGILLLRSGKPADAAVVLKEASEAKPK